MGAASSSPASSSAVDQIFASSPEKSAFEKIISETPVSCEDAAYDTVLSSPKPLSQLSQTQVDLLTREYGETLAQNSLQSGNFRVLLHYVIHLLPLSCQAANMKTKEVAAMAPVAGQTSTDLHRAVNALFLVRQFTMRFVERSDEISLLSHFDGQGMTDFTRLEPQSRHSLSIQITTEDATKSSRNIIRSGTSSENLATHLLDTLVTTLIDFPPNEKTYDLHVEVLNTLLVLLSPVVYPRDHSKQANDLLSHNPFLHMLITSALPDGEKSYWAHGVVCRLLRNYSEQLQATGHSLLTNTTVIGLQKAREMSLVNMSELSDQEDEHEPFSYFTLEGVGSIAASIFRFPWSFIRYFTTREGTTSPLADRSILILLVLLQSCRDSDSVVTSNPFRAAFCGIGDGSDLNNAHLEIKEDTRAHSMQHDEPFSSSSDENLEISYAKLLQVLGSHATYETSHLMLYTLLYSNPMMAEAAGNDVNMERLVLPLLETLYRAQSVEPTRLYMLVIVLLTFTQDAAFVQTAHTRYIMPYVSWYREHYMLDVSLGSLMIIIFTRLIFRNITRFQDSFLHLNAFAALSNLARSAENLHVFAAQGIVGLIDMLAKNEAKLVTQMKGLNTREENDEVAQKRLAYVEFIRLLLGVVSSCLKTELLPRNPQLIYSLLHRGEMFAALQQHSEFAEYVHNGPVWSTLARFQALVDAKTSSNDVLDAERVLEIIHGECVGLLAASSAGVRTAASIKSSIDEDDASYRYEEETDPEQFFIPYIWKLIQEQTPEFCWKMDKITLFVPSGNRAY